MHLDAPSEADFSMPCEFITQFPDALETLFKGICTYFRSIQIFQIQGSPVECIIQKRPQSGCQTSGNSGKIYKQNFLNSIQTRLKSRTKGKKKKKAEEA